jgi:hypothetical protein
VQTGKEEKVYKLNKALHGLQLAPRASNQKLDASLVSLGFYRMEGGLFLEWMLMIC